MKLKVCGMKYNPETVAKLQPDYLGFIFWESSSRYFDKEFPSLATGIKKVGVFVDEKIEEVIRLTLKHKLDAVQFHGNESIDYLKKFKKAEAFKLNEADILVKSWECKNTKIIKVFSIKNEFDFSVLQPFEEVCDYFLFDTKGKLPGGNGYTFDWSILENYPSTKPYFLSGGIGLNNLRQIEEFLKKPESKYCHAIDVNSRFEDEPGLKNIDDLKKFKKIVIDNQ
ncbi:phosphoribosylanthranilate isomerase [Croceitalea sp. P059]|uniref:phosphoribosylanthranilate isomerase n=1 Tax=Croceitalea sp. P059 TaxID=3075601 RepID=UPI002888C8B8|nr:phosphoribosylanthranilate isomerase [Croceitalea sp. P059]MDT0541038.1 phosphoribosylanthranilate isomerase [Croceitalea sp. P059]